MAVKIKTKIRCRHVFSNIEYKRVNCEALDLAEGQVDNPP